MFAEKITEEQRVERAHVQIMRHKNYIFLTNILMMGRGSRCRYHSMYRWEERSIWAGICSKSYRSRVSLPDTA